MQEKGQFSNCALITINYCIKSKNSKKKLVSVEFHRWRQVATVGVNEFKCLCEDLMPNEIYVFRVCAVNAAGNGQPSRTIDVETPDGELTGMCMCVKLLDHLLFY